MHVELGISKNGRVFELVTKILLKNWFPSTKLVHKTCQQNLSTISLLAVVCCLTFEHGFRKLIVRSEFILLGLKKSTHETPISHQIRLHRCWWRMLETKCVGDNSKILYLLALASGTDIQKMSPRS